MHRLRQVRIDFNICKLCRKCVAECPTGAIHAVNFPPKVERPAAEKPTAETEQTNNPTNV